MSNNNTLSHDSNVPWGDYLDDYSMQEKVKRIQNIRDPDARRMAKIMHENEERERIKRRKREEEERLARERHDVQIEPPPGQSSAPPPGQSSAPPSSAPPAAPPNGGGVRVNRNKRPRVRFATSLLSSSPPSVLVGVDPPVVVPAIPLDNPAPPPPLPPSAKQTSLELYDSDPWFWLHIPSQIPGTPGIKRRVFVLGDHSNRYNDWTIGLQLHALTPYSLDQDSGLRIPYPPRLRDSPPNARRIPTLYDPLYSAFRVDWIDPSVNQSNTPWKYYETGSDYLSHICEQAELKDMEFARNMQGLLGVNAAYTWACLQPDFDPSDRHSMLNLYIHSKIQSTLVNVDLTTVDPPDVAHEMIRQYKTFNQEWAKLHYKNITPVITSHCETLVEKCIQAIPPRLHWMPRIYLARTLWRCEDTRTPWQQALYWHITDTEQNRGGRNPSYKQMNNSLNHYAQSYYALIRSINQANWDVMIPENNVVLQVTRIHTIDWHSIVGQLPYVHKKFQSMRSYNAMEYGAQAQRMQGVGGSRWRFAPGEGQPGNGNGGDGDDGSDDHDDSD